MVQTVQGYTPNTQPNLNQANGGPLYLKTQLQAISQAINPIASAVNGVVTGAGAPFNNFQTTTAGYGSAGTTTAIKPAGEIMWVEYFLRGAGGAGGQAHCYNGSQYLGVGGGGGQGGAIHGIIPGSLINNSITISIGAAGVPIGVGSGTGRGGSGGKSSLQTDMMTSAISVNGGQGGNHCDPAYANGQGGQGGYQYTDYPSHNMITLFWPGEAGQSNPFLFYSPGTASSGLTWLLSTKGGGSSPSTNVLGGAGHGVGSNGLTYGDGGGGGLYWADPSTTEGNGGSGVQGVCWLTWVYIGGS